MSDLYNNIPEEILSFFNCNVKHLNMFALERCFKSTTEKVSKYEIEGEICKYFVTLMTYYAYSSQYENYDLMVNRLSIYGSKDA